jgi:hypothetical protein
MADDIEPIADYVPGSGTTEPIPNYDPSNPPEYRQLYRAEAYGPSQGEYTRATLYGPLGQLQQGDIAVSPNMLASYPLGSRWNVVDDQGNVLREGVRVADTS